MRLLTILGAAALLTGCAAAKPHWDRYTGVRTDKAIWSTIVRKAYYERGDMAVACLDSHGAFTGDGRACYVGRRKTCYFLTTPADMTHDTDLTAMCNGWNP